MKNKLNVLSFIEIFTKYILILILFMGVLFIPTIFLVNSKAKLHWNIKFKLHLNGAINNGCNFHELKELFLQIAVYCGVPTGVECFKHAEEFFKLSDIDINKEMS